MSEIDARFLDRRLPNSVIFATTFDGGAPIDLSTSNRTATVSAGATFISSVADFNGAANAVITYPDSNDFDSVEQSVSFWARIDGGTYRMNLVAKNSNAFAPSRSRGWCIQYLGFSDGAVGILFRIGSDDNNFRAIYTGSPGTYNDTAWRHFVCVRDSLSSTANWRIYVNGVSVSTTSSTLGTVTSLNNSEVFRLAGQAWYNQSAILNGALDDVVIFNRILTANDAMELYRSTKNKTRP